MAPEEKRELTWSAILLVVAVAFVANFALTTHHPPVGCYVALLGLAAAAVTLREGLRKREKASWIVLMFSFACLEIFNLYKDRDQHDHDTLEARQQEDAKFERNVNEITGGPSYAVVTPVTFSDKRMKGFRMIAGIGKNGERFNLTNVRLSVRQLPIKDEGSTGHALDVLAGIGEPLVWHGSLDPESFTPLPFEMNIMPSTQGTTNYVVNVFASNKPTTERLDVRFNGASQKWEYSFTVIRAITIGGPGKPDTVQTLEKSEPEWISSVFIPAK